jgi:preprotein translocase subunit SecF
MTKLSGLGGRLYRGDTSVNFIGKSRRWYAFSGILIIASAIALSTQGLHLGIEFKGGSEFTVTKTNISLVDARAVVASTGIPGDVIIQKIGTNKVRVQTGALSNDQSNKLEDALAAKFSVPTSSIDTQIVGPSWGKEITRKALYGL